MKLSIYAPGFIHMKYSMHGVVASLLNFARKSMGKDYGLPLLDRREACLTLRKSNYLPIFGGHITFLDSNGQKTFYCFMQGKRYEPVIPWNQVLLLIKASYHRYGIPLKGRPAESGEFECRSMVA